jgi:hypothetical protein
LEDLSILVENLVNLHKELSGQVARLQDLFRNDDRSIPKETVLVRETVWLEQSQVSPGTAKVDAVKPKLLTAAAAIELVDQELTRELTPNEEEILLVLLARIEKDARQGYRTLFWKDLDPNCNRSPKIESELRKLGFTVHSFGVTFAKVVKS